MADTVGLDGGAKLVAVEALEEVGLNAVGVYRHVAGRDERNIGLILDKLPEDPSEPCLGSY